MDQPLRIAALAALVVCAPCLADCPPPGCETGKIILALGVPPGSPTEALARVLAQALEKKLGAGTVMVVNRPGGGGLHVASHVAKQPADSGFALLATSSLGYASAMHSGLDFDPDKDLRPAALVSSLPYALVVGHNADVRSLQEFVAKAKKSWGALTYGSSGNGSAEHLVAERFNQAYGVRLTHVPFKGSAAALAEMVGGRVDCVMLSPAAAEAAKPGGARVLAITGSKRSGKLPDTPTFAQLGMADMALENRVVLYVPGSTPRPALESWNKAVADAVNSPEVKSHLDQQGASPGASLAPDAVAKLLTTDNRRWLRIIRWADVKPE